MCRYFVNNIQEESTIFRQDTNVLLINEEYEGNQVIANGHHIVYFEDEPELGQLERVRVIPRHYITEFEDQSFSICFLKCDSN